MTNEDALITPFEFRQRRLYLRMTQKKMAKALGLRSGDTIKAWENSATPISGPAALALEMVWRLKRRGGPVSREILSGLWD